MFQYTIDEFLVFHDYLRVSGGFAGEPARPRRVTLCARDYELAEGRIGVKKSHFRVPDEWPRCFSLTALLPEGADHRHLSLAFHFHGGECLRVPYESIAEFAGFRNEAEELFISEWNQGGKNSVLEVGSRARSGIARRQLFGNRDYVGLDVLPGENVDVVGDAHELSRLFPDRRFDAVYCISTFEHLAMPWKAVVEINRVLNPGGICFIHSHQTIGLHDMPWDFFRFSDSAWHSLFNEHTGFRVEKTVMREDKFVVPRFRMHDMDGYEGSLGFTGSSVFTRKVGETTLDWPVPAASITKGLYPG